MAGDHVNTLFNDTTAAICLIVTHRKYFFFILFLTFINYIMVNCFCSLALYFNNSKSKDSNCDKLKYYCLPRENSEIQSQ